MSRISVIGPARDHNRADKAGERIHPDPAEQAAEHQADDDQNGDRGIGQHVNDRGAQVVVAMRGGRRGVMMVMHGMIVIMRRGR